MADWVSLGPADEVPEEGIRAYQVGGKKIAVGRRGGRLFALDDTCTHAGCSLAEDGELEEESMVCGCHFSEFDLETGEVLDGPAPEPLGAYRVAVEEGELRLEQ